MRLTSIESSFHHVAFTAIVLSVQSAS